MSYCITQLSYKEGLFNFDNGIYRSGSSISVSITPIMRLSKEKDNILILQLTASYCMGEKVIMKYGGLVIYMVDNLREMINDTTIFDDFKIYIWQLTMQFFRGIICEKLKGTSLDTVFLPILEKNDIKSIKIEEIND